MATMSMAEVRAKMSSILDSVRDTHRRVTITRNGRPEAVILSIEDYESMEETMAILSTPGALQQIHEAEQQLDQGQGIGADQLRDLMAERERREHGA